MKLFYNHYQSGLSQIQETVLKFSKDTEVNAGRHSESKRLGNLLQIKIVDIIDLLQAVGIDGTHISLVGLLGWPMEEVVLLNQLLQLNRQLKQMYSFGKYWRKKNIL